MMAVNSPVGPPPHTMASAYCMFGSTMLFHLLLSIALENDDDAAAVVVSVEDNAMRRMAGVGVCDAKNDAAAAVGCRC